MTDTHEPAPLAYRIPAATKASGIPRSSLYALIKSGDLKVIKVGNRTLIARAELERLVGGAA